MNFFILFLCGAAGALVKDVVKDNRLEMPCLKAGFILLGFLGGMVIGGFAGYVADHDPMTAFLGGFAGYVIIESLVKQNLKDK